MKKFFRCRLLVPVLSLCLLQANASSQGGEKLVWHRANALTTAQEPATENQQVQPQPAPQPQPPPPPPPDPLPVPELPNCPTELLCEIIVDGVCVNKVFKTQNCRTNEVSHITFPCVETTCSCTGTSCLCVEPTQLGGISTSSSFPAYRHFGSVRTQPITLVDAAKVTVNKVDPAIVVNEDVLNLVINGKERTLKLLSISFTQDTNTYTAKVGIEVKKQTDTAATGYRVEYMGSSAIIGKLEGTTVTEVYPVRLGP